jgi:anti-anti-sigma factor
MPQTLVFSDLNAAPFASASPVFRCTLGESGLDAAWIRVAGELDIATAQQLEPALRAAEIRARRVVLDLRELTFMDSSGVHVIVDASNRARRTGRQLVLVRGPSHIDRLFALTDTSNDVKIVDLDCFQPSVQALVKLGSQSAFEVGRLTP